MLKLKDLFTEILEASGKLRPNYPDSLGVAKSDWSETFLDMPKLPNLYKEIYSMVQGTKRDISDQSLMDFIPGYRLIHISELKQEKVKMDNILNNEDSYNTVIPLLTNYSSDFICYAKSENEGGVICSLMHDDGELIVMHHSSHQFLLTINKFYKQHVYFLDEDDYLDFSWEREEIIGEKLNPSAPFWS